MGYVTIYGSYPSIKSKSLPNDRCRKCNALFDDGNCEFLAPMKRGSSILQAVGCHSCMNADR